MLPAKRKRGAASAAPRFEYGKRIRGLIYAPLAITVAVPVPIPALFAAFTLNLAMHGVLRPAPLICFDLPLGGAQAAPSVRTDLTDFAPVAVQIDVVNVAFADLDVAAAIAIAVPSSSPRADGRRLRAMSTAWPS